MFGDLLRIRDVVVRIRLEGAHHNAGQIGLVEQQHPHRKRAVFHFSLTGKAGRQTRSAVTRVNLRQVIERDAAQARFETPVVSGGQCANQIRFSGLRMAVKAQRLRQLCRLRQTAGFVAAAFELQIQAIRFQIQTRCLFAGLFHPFQRVADGVIEVRELLLQQVGA